ncbi:MAG: zinc-binding dehydrogenase [Actinobacteria bacterium]|nr:zinc-binding dehydrogenase [Actinomycetota bacterium]
MDGIMRAAVFDGSDKLDVRNIPISKLISKEDVLLKVKVASICGTDLHILASKGLGGLVPTNTILGHEYVGEIIEVGSGINYLKIGDMVTVSNNIPCGYCDYCQKNLPNMCVNMRSIGVKENGGFAEYSIAPAKALYPIPKGLPIEVAVFAEPVSCVINALSKVKISPGAPVVILGAGPIGQIFVRLLRFMGVGKIIVSELSSYRTNLALKSGADRVLNPDKENIEEGVKAETGLGAELVVDAVGTLFGTALRLVCSGGTIILFGLARDFKGEGVISQTDIMLREITIKGSYISDYSFPVALRVLKQDPLKIEELISCRLEMSKINDGIELLRKGNAVKVIVYP